MPVLYDKEKIHKLFLECNGDFESIMIHKGMPKSRRTIKKYAIEGGWYKELSNNYEVSELDSIIRLEKIRTKIYDFLIEPFIDENEKELRPKTYNEAVKCYLEVDSRIDEKRDKISGSGIKSWEDILRDCVIPD